MDTETAGVVDGLDIQTREIFEDGLKTAGWQLGVLPTGK
jgi:hypothetical protein